LRAETAALLGVDPDDLSKTEGLRLDITSLLLLEIDSLQGSILANEKVDLARLSTALGMLQKLLPATALVAPALAPEERGDSEAFRQIAEQLDREMATRELKMARDPDAARAEFEARLAAAIEKHSSRDVFDAANTDASNPASGFARYGAVSPSAPVEQPLQAAGGSWPTPEPPVLISPAPPPQPKRESDVERMDRVNSSRPPANYLKQDDSPWRRHLDADGNIVAPYFRGGYG
jgi:hypothetical protein